jgi:tRNA threonylcarbamoyladenosine biosynthesis protein TsaE
MSEKFITKSFEETQKLGQDLAKKILSKNFLAKKTNKAKAVVLYLQGNLGSGKTTFLQGVAKGLGIKEKITSPTFVIMKRFGNFYHFDCYRINKPEEILELGWNDIISNHNNIIAIEWSEKIKKYLPKNAIKIDFKFIDQQTREIFLKI